MEVNPYQPPACHPTRLHAVSSRAQLTLGLFGASIGVLFGCLGAFVGGCLTGFTYRLFHDISYGGAGFLGFFKHTATPIEFALRHGTFAVLAIVLWGCVVGGVQGIRAAHAPIRITGILFFTFGGLLVGLVNGAFTTPGQSYLVPQLFEGPFAGGVFGTTTAAISWTFFRNRINAIALLPHGLQVFYLLVTLLFIFGCLLIFLGTVRVLGYGAQELQVFLQFAIIVLLASTFGVVWLLWRRGGIKRS